MIEPERISKLLGLPDIGSHHALTQTIAAGLPKTAARRLASSIAQDKPAGRDILYRLVPEATFKRRRDRLTPAESERVERLARVFATALYVWDDEDEARDFMIAAHPMLGGERPLDWAATELGAREVETILWRLFHGIAA